MDISADAWELIGRYLGAGIALGLGGIGAAFGMGIAAGQAAEGMMRQPARQGNMLRTMLIGQAVGGSPSVFALVIGLLILLVPFSAEGGRLAAMLIGAGLSVGLGCFGSGWGCGYPAGAACDGLARNPRQGGQITSLMVVGQAVAQSPSVFSVVVALLLLFVPLPSAGMAAIGICIGAGIATGAAALGPGLGSGCTAGGAVEGVSRWPETRGLMLRTMLVAQAVCQTPAIFGLLIAFVVMFAMPDLPSNIIGLATVLGASISVGLGGIGPGIGSGIAGDSGCRASAARPRHSALILRTLLIGQAVSQSTAIYGLLIALTLLMVIN